MENQNIELTPGKFIKTLSLIHLAMLGGMLLFIAIAYLQTESTQLSFDYENDIFFFLVPLLTIGGVTASFFLPNKTMQALSSESSLREKLTTYQTSSIIKYATLEGPSLFAIVSYLQTGNMYYLIFAGALIIYFFNLKPSKFKIEMDLKLNHEHQFAFNQMDEVIK